jgi:hypothetical protein
MHFQGGCHNATTLEKCILMGYLKATVPGNIKCISREPSLKVLLVFEFSCHIWIYILHVRTTKFYIPCDPHYFTISKSLYTMVTNKVTCKLKLYTKHTLHTPVPGQGCVSVHLSLSADRLASSTTLASCLWPTRSTSLSPQPGQGHNQIQIPLVSMFSQ